MTIKCRECKEEVEVMDVGEHWKAEHSTQVKEIRKWLEEGDWKLEQASRIVKEQEGEGE